MFRGLSAFPLTPHRHGEIDLPAFGRLVTSAVSAGADSIGALGSTGAYAYLTRTERASVARVAVEAAGAVPVIVGVGAISTRAVRENVEDAAAAGAAAVLLAPVSYQPLDDAEVYALFEDVSTRFPDVPVVLYDNPRTTGFTFSEQLHVDIAQLPAVASIKLPSLPSDQTDAAATVRRLRGLIPPHVTIGISGDAAASAGLMAGCDTWYSVLAGTFPAICRRLTTAALDGDHNAVGDLSTRLAPIWEQFARFGSFRVTAALATLSGVLSEDAVYAPVRPLSGRLRSDVAAALEAAGPLA